MKWLGIAGSLRKSSHNRALLSALREELPEGVELTLFDGIGALPLFDADLSYDPPPPAVVALKDAMAGADGLVIATPEYNYSIPGVLKNALDWATRPMNTSPLRQMPVGLMGAAAGMSGTMRAQYHLRQILVYTDCRVMGQPEVFVARSHERFDAEGRLTCEATRLLLRTYAEGYAAWVRMVRPPA
jgi:chromate reductase, NAD(P)H dehydrogenase (quinone)